MKCQHVREDGSRCGSPENFVDPETGYCKAHGPGGSETMAEWGRRGAEAKHRKDHAPGLDEEDLPPLDSPQAATRWLEAVGRAVATGRLGHHEGTTVVRAVREFLRAHEKGVEADRIDALMDALAEWRRTGDPAPVLELVE